MARSRASSISSHKTVTTLSSATIDYHFPYNADDQEYNDDFDQTLSSFSVISKENEALLAALKETASDASAGAAVAVVSPNGLFVAILKALNSLCCSLEDKLKHHDGDVNDVRVEKEVSAILSLLELLRRICPFVVHYSNNEGALFGEYSTSPPKGSLKKSLYIDKHIHSI